MAHTRRSRALRGVLTAILACYVSLAAHVLAGGSAPHPLGVLVPVILASAVCVPLAGRSWSWPRRCAAVAVSQFLFHQLFLLGSAAPSETTTGSAADAAMAGHAAHGGAGTISAMTTAFSPDTTAAANDLAMMLLHLWAAALTVALLGSAGAACTVLRRNAGLRRLVELFHTVIVGTNDNSVVITGSSLTPVTATRRGPRASRAPPAPVPARAALRCAPA